MIRHAVLLFDNTPANPFPPTGRVAGLSLLDRGIRTLARAGIGHILVITPQNTEVYLDKFNTDLSIKLEHIAWGAVPPHTFAPSNGFLLLQADYVHHHSSLSALLKKGLAGYDAVLQGYKSDDRRASTVWINPKEATISTKPQAANLASSGALLCANDLFSLTELAGKATDLWRFLAARISSNRVALVEASPYLCRRVLDRKSARAAKTMLFDTATKSTSGLVARHLNVRISVPISKVLIETGVSPNMVTFFLVFLTGIAAAYLLTYSDHYLLFGLGGLLWQAASVLDGCDGEIARVKLAESKFGAWFDTVTDNLAYLSAYAGLILGMTKRYPADPLVIYPGISALVIFVLILAVMYLYAHTKGTGSLQTFLADLSHQLPDSRKDWTYALSERFGFITKRDFSSFFVFLSLAANLYELVYWSIVALIHLAALALALIQYKQFAAHRQASPFSHTSVSRSAVDGAH